MKIYVINLKRRSDKKEKMLKQFKDLSINNFEFIEAVDGNDLTKNEFLQVIDYKKMELISRKLTNAEIGCALSHKIVYEKIINGPEYRSIILEDDVILEKGFVNIASINGNSIANIDILFLGLSTSNIENDGVKKYEYQKIGKYITNRGLVSRCYFKDQKVKVNDIDFYKIHEVSYKRDFLISAYAYAPTKETCKKFLKANTPIIMQADYIWNFYHNFSMFAPLNQLVKYNLDDISDIETERYQYEHNAQHSNKFLQRINHPDFNT